MLFNSPEFFLFFPVVVILYFLMPYRYRWGHLLLASCFFYCFFIPAYILVLFFVIVIDYWAGIYIEKSEGSRRKYFLAASIVANIGLLVVMKYYNFFVGNTNSVLQLFYADCDLPLWHIILPVGLSFHTFQALSYTIEVYRGNQRAERHFGIYALYVMFFPQLVAGPIERPQNLLHQFVEKHDFSYRNAVSGLRLILWGLFKKAVIADRLAILVDEVYARPTDFQGLPLAVATLFFAIEIYCDFSGYSDIAIGSARVLGFNLMKNFNSPYFSISVSEFWNRWHISLSRWFRDYVYIPLGGNRVALPRWLFNIFTVFLLSGLWHGANWTFVVWGGLNAIYQVAEIMIRKKTARFHFSGNTVFRLLGWLCTFVLITLAWVFFRATSINEAWYIISHMAGKSFAINNGIELEGMDSLRKFYDDSFLSFAIAGSSVAFLFVAEWAITSRNYAYKLFHEKAWIRLLVYYSLVLSVIFLGIFEKRQFIYFQF